MEFKAFGKINALRNTRMQISQKIHGTNAQVMIVPAPENEPVNTEELVEFDGKVWMVRAGSRTRWIYPGDDNYGFAAFVRANIESFVRCLGPGQHFGEWAGLGINSGEGLTSKVFCLFDYWRHPAGKPMPPQCVTVPVLYEGTFDLGKIDEVMADLKANGSKLVPGFMRPEGVVINVLGHQIKKVFDAEETQWKGGDPLAKALKEKELDTTRGQIEHLLQPIRLEKLISRDERYLSGFPRTMPDICKDYIQDLIDEGQIAGDESQIASIKKILGKHIFGFIKAHAGVSQ